MGSQPSIPGDLVLLGEQEARYLAKAGASPAPTATIEEVEEEEEEEEEGTTLEGSVGMSVAPGRVFLFRMSRTSAFTMGM